MNIILTGGHSGMGLELSKCLLAEGHSVDLIVRSEKRKKDAIAELGSSKKLDIIIADLGNCEAINQVVSKISESWGIIDGLF